MFDLSSLLKIPGMGTLISILLGFGLAAMFRPLCKGPDCLIMRGPPVQDVRNSVYQFGARCVEFDAKPIECKSAGNIPLVDTMTFAEI
jgi:hypothetical protein